jgi:hypothetical protein
MKTVRLCLDYIGQNSITIPADKYFLLLEDCKIDLYFYSNRGEDELKFIKALLQKIKQK